MLITICQHLTTNFGTSMFANFSTNHKIENLATRFRLLIGIFLFILSIVGVGCFPPIVSKDLFPDVAKRHPPEVQLGPELVLFEKPPILSTSLIDMTGVAHVFLVDKERRLHHIEIICDKITKREALGVIENKKAKTLDAIEHPPGKIRVLSGDKQFFRSAPNAEWLEIKGNRCARFLLVGDELFCAFITKGEEIHVPERTDYTYGWFLLVPIIYWSHKHAAKLVLAQESPDGWSIRAVVDPDSKMDTDDDFVIGTDSLQNIHFLYFTSKGGRAFVFLCAGISCMGGASDPKIELRYAQLTFDQLLAHSADAKNQTSSKVANPLQWVANKGKPLGNISCIGEYSQTGELNISPSNIRPLNRSFSVDKLSGDMNGLLSASGQISINGNRKVYLTPDDRPMVEVSIHGELWSSNCDIVAGNDLPVTNYRWQTSLIKIDPRGNKHVLLESSEIGFWSNHYKIYYLVKENANWSAPLFLGPSKTSSDSSIAIGNTGAVFASWVNKKNKLVGRWIRPRNENH